MCNVHQFGAQELTETRLYATEERIQVLPGRLGLLMVLFRASLVLPADASDAAEAFRRLGFFSAADAFQGSTFLCAKSAADFSRLGKTQIGALLLRKAAAPAFPRLPMHCNALHCNKTHFNAEQTQAMVIKADNI